MVVVASQDAPPTVEEVTRICRIDDAVIRNLEITHCYSRLAAAMASRTGQMANWCAFATWASRQAGQTIRGEDLLENLHRRLRAGGRLRHPIRAIWRWLLRKGVFEPRTRLGRVVATLHTPFDAFERASQAVGRGNLKVFEEIGLEFARYLSECPASAAADSPAFSAFASRLRPGDAPEGQEYLRRAFARYQEAGRAADPRARAALALLANLEIGLHEQTRLQPEICAAMDAGVVTAADLKRRLLEALLPHPWIRAVLGRRPVVAIALGVARAFQAHSRDLAREVVTESLMVLRMPGDLVLPLGRHLSMEVPASIRAASLADLAAFMTRFEPHSAACVDCGASDWSSLDQRMHYIAHLFQAFHEHDGLFQPPFTPSQVQRFRAGIVPDGIL